ncbi:hypothetical protein HDV04_003916 [Boothiomyces sp. JEL0838]|nr:hypothetical protein HDV04_001355 [Boothiomyces sp. JEL0838]KAJ3311538.1 hypothetical protein HDV04_003916 [Boothiomyces sp. JEL0838]
MANQFKFNWQPWARIQGIGAASFIFMAAVIQIFYPDLYIALINFAISILIVALEYPPLGNVPFLGTNYFFRFLLYTAMSVFGMISAPSTTGAMCLFCSALTYLRAGINGESGGQKPSKK